MMSKLAVDRLVLDEAMVASSAATSVARVPIPESSCQCVRQGYTSDPAQGARRLETELALGLAF
jgi:hypothetical protein